MAYDRNTQQLGNIAQDVSAFLRKLPSLAQQSTVALARVEQFLPIIVTVLSDPALPQLQAKIERMRDLAQRDASKAAQTAPAAPPSAQAVGIGLKKLLPLMDAAIFYEEHPHALPIAGIAAVLLIGTIGYKIGKRRRA